MTLKIIVKFRLCKIENPTIIKHQKIFFHTMIYEIIFYFVINLNRNLKPLTSIVRRDIDTIKSEISTSNFEIRNNFFFEHLMCIT